MSATTDRALLKTSDVMVRRRQFLYSYCATIAAATAMPGTADKVGQWMMHAGISRVASRHKIDISMADLASLAKSLADSSTAQAPLGGRFKSVARFFASLVLFEDYCRRLHVGLKIDSKKSQLLADSIVETLTSTDLRFWSSFAGDYFRAAKQSGVNSALVTRLRDMLAQAKAKLKRDAPLMVASPMEDNFPSLWASFDSALASDGPQLAPLLRTFHLQWRNRHGIHS